MPSKIEELFTKGIMSDIHWAAFGPDKECYVLSYVDKYGNDLIVMGDRLPQKLKNYLYDPRTRTVRRGKHVRVTFGPNDSFFAWDRASMRWENLPPVLEDCIQSWLCPTGWRCGPPLLISLGFRGSFFVMSELGSAAWAFPKNDLDQLSDVWLEWRSETGFRFDNLLCFALDPTSPGNFIALRTDGRWTGHCSESNIEFLHEFVDSLDGEAAVHARKMARASAADPSAHNTTPHSLPRRPSSPDHKHTSGGTNRRPTQPLPRNLTLKERELEFQRTAHIAFAHWQMRVEAMLKLSKNATSGSATVSSSTITFPHIPTSATFCTEPTCIMRKSDRSGLLACRHDVERLLRGSQVYSYDWLRKERLKWHPDRFSRRFNIATTETRMNLVRKSEELYKIFGELIEAEKGTA